MQDSLWERDGKRRTYGKIQAQPAWRPVASVVRLFLCNYKYVCAYIVFVTACQTAHSLCGKVRLYGGLCEFISI